MILKFGRSLYKKVNKPHSVYYVRQRMRQTARDLHVVKELDCNIEKLKDPLNLDSYIGCKSMLSI